MCLLHDTITNMACVCCSTPHNFGALGVLLGHEITHAFDARGQRFDAHGWLVPKARRWSVFSRRSFAKRERCVAKHYGGFKFWMQLSKLSMAEHFVDGGRTVNEDLADIGGLALAFKAWNHTCGGKQRPVDRSINSLMISSK